MAEIQDNGGGKKGKGSKQKKMAVRVDFIKAEKNGCSRRLHADGGYEHAFDYFLYALYLVEQTSDDGN